MTRSAFTSTPFTPGRRSGTPRILSALAVALLLSVSAMAADVGGLSDKLLNQAAAKYGQAAKARLLDWQNLINSGKNKSEAEKLVLANTFFNRLPYVDDIIHWGKPDYWATPVEMIASNGGDCEDFSIAKYFTLKEMGVPVERMRITYVKSLKLNQAHMVLTYYPTPDADPLVLDNLITEIKPASERTDLVPVYSFNGQDLWVAKERGRGKRVGTPNQIGLWRDLNARMDKEDSQ